LGLLCLGAVILAAYSSFGRPIWLDELFHFAMGGMTFEYAVKTVDYSTIEVGHGQTGVYLLLDWWLMQGFGANSVALRLPSLIAGAVLLVAAVTFIRRKGLGYWWQALVLVVLAGHSFLMYFTGEARPYMPLVASSVAMLAYYAYPRADRKAVAPRVLAVFGFLIGSTFQPFWIYMVVFILAFSVWAAWVSGDLDLKWREILVFTSPGFLLSGMALFLVVGELTWMRRILYLNFEPWVHIGGSFSEAARYFLADHFSGGGISVLWASGISVLTLVVLGVTRFNGARLLLPAFVLLLVAVLTSLAASGIALWRTYWVLERQWVAGIAIACIASVWFFGELYSLARRNQTPIILIPVGLFVILSLVTMAVTMRAEAEKLLVGYPAARAAIIDDGRPPPELGIGQYGGMDGVEAANLNIARGGPVWIEFIDWYNREAGMRAEFRDTNPSWTKYIWPNVAEHEPPRTH
jgi:hypothetical protein